MTTTKTVHTLPSLPYAIDALAPQISRETMEYHYGKHHRGYVEKLNKLIVGTEFANSSIEDIIRYSDGPIFDNGAQAWNHTFYFLSLAPNPKSVPTGTLSRRIDRDFGSFDNLKEQLLQSCLSLFGSGWVWLAYDKRDQLLIMPYSNAGNPIRDGYKPIMAIDVWEHAYYIDYRNSRSDGVKALMERVDWRVVEERFRSANSRS